MFRSLSIKLNKRLFSTCSNYGLDKWGITKPNTIHYNLKYDELFNHERNNNEGVIFDTKYGETFGVDTGKFTGRSPKDKWIVKNLESDSNNNLWWGDINQPISPEVFDSLYQKAINHFNTLDSIYLFDGFCGSSPESQKKVRFVHELAWQQHFVTNMFIRPDYQNKTPTNDCCNNLG